jgi:hypothetical protein
LRFFALEFDDEFELELLEELFDEFELELLDEFEEELLDELLLEFDEELLDEFMLELLEEFEDEMLLEFPAVANGAPTATTPVAASAAAHFLLSISLRPPLRVG